MVSGSLSLPALGCFSPVPHGTRPLSVIQESLALEGGPPSFTPGSSYRALLRNSTSACPSSWPTGLSPSLARLSRRLRLTSQTPSVGPTTPPPQGGRFGLRRFRSPLLSASRLISLPHGTESSPGSLHPRKDDDGPYDPPGFPIRPPGAHWLCAPPPGFSQLTAAFLASVYPGIPRTLSFA